MRRLPRSATNSRPWESIARECGERIWPSSKPHSPKLIRKVPSGANLETRLLESGPGASWNCAPWVSATKMLPSGATSTSLGSVKCVGGSPSSPGVPSVSNSSPVGLNLRTVLPLPAALGLASSSRALAARASTTQTLPSWSTSMPWGQRIRPAPKLATTLPSGSSFTIGSRSEPAQELAPQRSPIHTWRPSTSILMALTEPQVRPAGGLLQLRTVS